jgi:hypothetical protein
VSRMLRRLATAPAQDPCSRSPGPLYGVGLENETPSETCDVPRTRPRQARHARHLGSGPERLRLHYPGAGYQLHGEHPRKAQRAAMNRAVTSLTRMSLVIIRRTLGRKRCDAEPAGAPPCGPGRLGGGQQRSACLPSPTHPYPDRRREPAAARRPPESSPVARWLGVGYWSDRVARSRRSLTGLRPSPTRRVEWPTTARR